MKQIHYLIFAFLGILLSGTVFYFTYDIRENDNWVAPYLSAAANLQPGGKFTVDSAEIQLFKDLDINTQYAYSFSKSDEPIEYNHNPIGFAYIIRFATVLIPFTGDLSALIILQTLMHIFLCILILSKLQGKWAIWIFIVLYAFNPVVLNIVVLNYYYFWQCVPGFILVYLYLDRKYHRVILSLLTLTLIFATLARPTILLISVFVLLMYFRYTTFRFALVSLISGCALFVLLNKPTEKNIWHTMYVGIAAYPNEYVQELSDDTGYALYLKTTGDTLDARFGGNYYSHSVINKYTEITKEEVLSIAGQAPLMLARNAFLNFFQIFSIGYLNSVAVLINILSALSGLIIFLLLLRSRQYLLITGIILSAITFCVYYPPIQAYLFGAYSMSVIGFIGLLAHYFPAHVQLKKSLPENGQKKKLLYICSNDGSDMRINKELRSLSMHFEITYIGIGIQNTESYARHYCKYFYLIIGKRNTIWTMLRQVFLVLRLKPSQFDSMHVINEQLMVFFYPLLFGRHVVLDIFDSIFLMWNKGKNKWNLVKRIVYAPVDIILVTDENRLHLMPDFTHKKVRILENFPYRYTLPARKQTHPEKLTILYSGWLGQHRGTELLLKLLNADPKIKVIMAGWFADDASRTLASHPQVEYRGIMTQEESHTIAVEEADYILCVYAPVNENNINASPNKIYDAIQTATPVIINAEIKIASFVQSNHLGIIIDDYYHFDIPSLLQTLYQHKNDFAFSDQVRDTYTWEHIEHVLTEAHHT